MGRMMAVSRTGHPDEPYWPWEKRFPTSFSPHERCDFCHKRFLDAPYIYRRSYVGASENTEVDLACKECIEKPRVTDQTSA